MLDVSGALLIDLDGEDLAVCASGRDIVVAVRRPRAVFRRVGPPLRTWRVLRAASRRLETYGLTVTISCNGAPILTIGANARATVLWRLVGLPNVSFAGTGAS